MTIQTHSDTLPAERLHAAIQSRTATVGICGLGYVGLPLAIAAHRARFDVIGFDIDRDKVNQLNAGTSYLGTVHSGAVRSAVAAGRFNASIDFDRLAECDVIIVCVPTPLTRQREPDLSYVERTMETILRRLRPGQLIVLESTTYPGTTSEVVRPILERTGLASGADFFLGFSPEREDPGNREFGTETIPKVVSGDGNRALQLVSEFYSTFVSRIVPVSSLETAEAVKITENVFRAVNIALVNELKLVYAAFGVDIWEVIEAAKTKPFGYMAFYPGPGLGGHCIPIDPFYLTWKARELGLATRFIELAGEINTAMPGYVVRRLDEALKLHSQTTLAKSRILLIGVAYKKNVSDTRESPALDLIERLEKRGAKVDFHDPHVDSIPPTREHGGLAGRRSVSLHGAAIRAYDAAIIVTDHDAIDYPVLQNARLIVDTRNACAGRGVTLPIVVKA
jgi:UDP-N-acetyl-D-glucosamine dehydrogenase